MSTFFVYCRSCGRIEPGQIKFACKMCGSTNNSGTSLAREPQDWDDILSSDRVSIKCQNENCLRNTFAEFTFSCSKCSLDRTLLIRQIKYNWQLFPCAICTEVKSPVVQFHPVDHNHFPHIVCLCCFEQYASVSLHSGGFILHPLYGYTLQCPISGCNAHIEDPHLFYVMGAEMYDSYKLKAAETLLMTQGGGFCPNPACGAAFFLDIQEPTTVVICPHCGVVTCLACRMRKSECTCNTQNLTDVPEERLQDLYSAEAVRSLSRPCPRCMIPTEKNGGCNHMSCRCGFQWCWICNQEWQQDCMWSHWFE